MKEDVKVKKIAKPILQTATSAPPAEIAVTTAPVATFSFGLRFLRKKDGSTILQEGIDDVWSDVPMVVEK